MTSVALGTVLEGTKGSEKADRLILVNLSSSECHAWLTAMRDAGQRWHEVVVDDLVTAKALLQAHPLAHVLICFDTPEDQIAKGISDDCVPSQALANWMNLVESLLELYREHYQRMTLVRQDALFNKQKALFEQLALRSGIALGRVTLDKPESAEPNQLHQQQSAMKRLLALQALHYSPAQRLVQELEASSLPLVDSVRLLDFLDVIYDTFKDAPGSNAEANHEEYQELEEKLEDLQQENDLVIEQLHKTQEELEKYLLGKKQNTQKVEKLERDIQQLRVQLASRNQELKSLRSSKSWTLTAPLRKSMKILGGKKGGET